MEDESLKQDTRSDNSKYESIVMKWLSKNDKFESGQWCIDIFVILLKRSFLHHEQTLQTVRNCSLNETNLGKKKVNVRKEESLRKKWKILNLKMRKMASSLNWYSAFFLGVSNSKKSTTSSFSEHRGLFAMKWERTCNPFLRFSTVSVFKEPNNCFLGIAGSVTVLGRIADNCLCSLKNSEKRRLTPQDLLRMSFTLIVYR